MKIRAGLIMTATMGMGFATAAHAGDLQVGDLRLDSATYNPDTGVFDPGFTEQTRTVLTAPDAARINSAFIGGSQNANGVADSGTDIRLRTFSVSTQIQNISRFGPSTNGGTSGPSRVGMVQWNIDLSPLDTYLADNSLSLTELDLDLITTVSDATKNVDVYLSYTNVSESIALTSIDNSTVGDAAGDDGAGALNWVNFFNPARAANVDDVVNGTHKLLEKDHTGALNLNEDLTSLFNDGVREFNLQLAGGDFWSGRQINIQGGSGISITTEAATSLVGDYNSDGFVSQGDLDLVLLNWGDNVAPAGFNEDNLDGGGPFDGLVSQNELDGVLLNWGNGTAPGLTAVPEPTTAALLGLGGLAALRRRRSA